MSVETQGVNDVRQIKGEFDTLQNNLKTLVKQQDEQIQAHGQVSTQLAKRLDDADAKWCALGADLKGLQAKYDDAALKAGRETLAAGGADHIKSPGQILIESAGFKSMIAVRGQRSMAVPAEFGGGVKSFLRTKSADNTSASLGALVDAMRLQQVIQSPLRPVRVMDLIPTIGTSSNSVEWVRENQTHEIATPLSAQAASAQADLVLGLHPTSGKPRTTGYFVDQVVTISPGLAQEEDGTILSIDAATGTITLTANLTNTHPADRLVTSDEFVFTPEAEIKPCSRIETELVTEAIKTLATWQGISRQMLDDHGALQGMIDQRMRRFMENQLERQILVGDGSTDQLAGILNDPDINVYSQSSGAPGDLELDALRRASTLVGLSFFPTDAFVLHDTDFEAIETSKASDGHYIFNQVQSGPGVQTVWRAPIVVSPVIDQGTALAGSFSMGSILWDREQITMRVSEHHEDFFARNMVALLAELRASLSVPLPKAFVAITFDSVPP
jgi:hypothetical protein